MLRQIGSPLLLLVFVAAVAACSQPVQAVPLRTASAPSDACGLALASGQLVAQAESGLALASATGEVTPVVWPYGYTARRESNKIALVDEKGAVVAREGDFVEVGGGYGNDGEFNVCTGTVQVVPQSS